MKPFCSGPSSEQNVVAGILHGGGGWKSGQITNPAEHLRLPKKGAGLSNLSGAITHTFTLSMHPDRVSEPRRPAARGGPGRPAVGAL